MLGILAIVAANHEVFSSQSLGFGLVPCKVDVPRHPPYVVSSVGEVRYFDAVGVPVRIVSQYLASPVG